ncbi:MAG: PDZ domain-containing protein [Clostridia bacterium]|nr:PDZ domain-containing protein [Clostridia bacterium]
MKILKKIILIIVLLILLIYVTNITSIPDSIILFKGENLNLNTVFGVNIVEKNYKAVQASSNLNNNEVLETKTVSLSLFNIINIKEIEVNTIPNTKVIPLGNSIGLKLYTSGVLVVGMTEIEGKKPYENTGIEEGDMIVEINQKEVTCTAELIDSVNNSNGEDLNIKYVRDGVEYMANIEPIKTEDNEYKLGLWVRDGAAGIGTVSYYEPSTKQYAALGHGIIDIDTQELINISSGELVTSKIASIVKGEEGIPRRDKR